MSAIDDWLGIKKPTASMTAADKKMLKALHYKMQDGKCKHCGRKIPADLMDLDRKKAGANGGGYTPSNTQLLCRTCNTAKGSKSDSKAKKQLAPSITGKKRTTKKKPKSDDSWGFGF